METPEIVTVEVTACEGTSDNNSSYQPPCYSSLTEDALPPSALSNETTVINTRVESPVVVLRTRPPRYSTVFHPGSQARTPVERNYPRRGQRLERDSNHARTHSVSGPQTHEYHISSNGSKTKAWATLKIYSRSSANCGSSGRGPKMPKFTGSDIVHGSLDLDLEVPHTINSISLSLRGQVITSSFDDGAYTFLDLPIVSWTRANGDPRTMILPSGPGEESVSSTLRTKKFDGKFSGKYSWPFSFPFPEAVSLPGQEGQSNNIFPSPQTFLERGTKGNVRYELLLRMSHGMLRSDSRLQAEIIYVPNILPPPSSELCQLAYSEHLDLPGPEIDPAGWCTLSPTTLSGRIFKDKKVKLQCTLSLSDPQCYTRGTIIPCCLSIRCKDTQALDLLSKPESVVVRLVRSVQYYRDTRQSLLVNKQAQNVSPTSTVTGSGSRGGLAEDLVQIEKAVWWVDTNQTETDESAHCRQLRGEIHLGKELQPSCEFPFFKVSYAVELLTFDSSAFTIVGSRTNNQVTKGESSKAILQHPVTIATLQGEGPAPIPVTTPKPRKERGVLRNSAEININASTNAQYQGHSSILSALM